jgi:ADP-heptose:LPS heptosyltransferase
MQDNVNISKRPVSKRTILVLKLAAFGDIINALRAIAAAFQANQSYQLIFITDIKYKSLVDKLIHEFELSDFCVPEYIHAEKLFRGNLLEKLKLIFELNKRIRNFSYDYFFILHRDWKYKLALYKNLEAPVFYLNRNHSRAALHEYEEYFNLFKKINALPIFKTKKRKNISTEKIKIGIAIGGGINVNSTFTGKRWSGFNELVERLLKNSNFEIFLFGDETDESELLCFSKTSLSSPQVINLVGKTPFNELVEKIKTLDGFVSVDTGTAHLAAALSENKDLKLFTLFGPTDENIWRPYPYLNSKFLIIRTKELGCSPCYQNDGNFERCIFKNEKKYLCMQLITAEEVYKNILKTIYL